MAKNKNKRRKTQSGAGRMTHNQSIRFINALVGYLAGHKDLSMQDIADMCEVPLSQLNVWHNPTMPFSGTIDKDVVRRFCAAAGIGRDQLMLLAHKDPFVANYTGDIEDAPEYIYQQYLKQRKDDEDGPVDVLEDNADEIDIEEIDPASKAPADNVTAQSISRQAPASDELSAFERAIVTLLREHDAANATGAARDDEKIARLAEERDGHKKSLDEAEAKIAVNEATIKNLERICADLEKKAKRKDNEIARLREIVEKVNLKVACSDNYVGYIETDPLFTKRNLTPMDVYSIASNLWKDKLFFTKTAQKDLRTYHGDAYELLGALRALAVPINDYLHKDEPLSAEALYKAGGFEIALHETERTASDKKCRQERTVAYNGRQMFFEKHLKAGHGSDSLRIYFEFDREARCIVIGRCGDHLSTVRGF